jgi:iron complex outermembrane receptor protein
VALDYGFLDNRLTGTFEYYVKNTDDLLLEVPVAQPAAVERRLENIGKVKNTGFEAILDWLITNRPDLSWTAGLVFSVERNEVQDLGGLNFITTGFVSGQGQSGQVSQRILPGYPLGTFYGPEFVGHNDAGEQLFNQYEVQRDTAGREISRTLTGQTTAPGGDDYLPIGDANPDWALGLRTGLTWGGFDLNMLFRARVGMDVFNNTALVYGTKSNVLQDKNFLASALTDETGLTQPAIYSSRWIENGSYLRLANIVLGYTFQLPGAFVGAGSRARIYVAADNLFLITGYSGYDPEAHTDRGNLAVRGIDYLSYPRARVFTGGLRLTF